MKVLLLLASAVLAQAIPWPARAQPAGESRPAGAPGAPSAPAPTGDEATANALVEQAARAYDQGQLDEALRMLARAYELSPRPSILYNQAQVLRAKNDCAAALDSYRRFVAATAPGDPNRERAVRRQTEMQACVEERRAHPGAAPGTPGLSVETRPKAGAEDASAGAASIGAPPSVIPAAVDNKSASTPPHAPAPVRLALDRAPETRAQGLVIAPATTLAAPSPRVESGGRRAARVTGWALVGLGAVAAGTAAVLAWKAHSIQSEISSDVSQPTLMTWNDHRKSLQSEGERDARWARWCGAAAAVAGGGGAALLIVFRPAHSVSEVAQPAAAHDAAAIIGWSGTF